jgi:uncharacterized membrane protein
MGQAMIWFMSWFLLVFVLPVIVFAFHRGKLMEIKNAKNWRSQAAGKALVDIKVAAMKFKKINGLLFLPPAAAGLFSVIYSAVKVPGWGFTALFAIFAVLIIALWLCYYLIFRLRAEVVNDDVPLTAALTRTRRYNWGKFFLISTWLTGSLAVSIWIFNDSAAGCLFASLIYTLLMIAAALWTEFTVRIVQQKLTAGNTGDLYLDEDEYWLFGMIYHNPNDGHFLVNDRVGMNMSVNAAKPAGKAVLALTVLTLMAMPFIGVWIWSQELTPVKLILTENALTARHTIDKYVIPLGEIESAELLETLPSMIRAGGTGLDNLYKGNFRSVPYGLSRVCIQPKDPPFLVIKSGGHVYILNDADSAATRDVFLGVR